MNNAHLSTFHRQTRVSHVQAAAGCLTRPDLIGRGVAMAFVYKQKHVEDGIPAFRVNRLSCCGRYTGLSGSKG